MPMPKAIPLPLDAYSLHMSKPRRRHISKPRGLWHRPHAALHSGWLLSLQRGAAQACRPDETPTTVAAVPCVCPPRACPRSWIQLPACHTLHSNYTFESMVDRLSRLLCPLAEPSVPDAPRPIPCPRTKEEDTEDEPARCPACLPAWWLMLVVAAARGLSRCCTAGAGPLGDEVAGASPGMFPLPNSPLPLPPASIPAPGRMPCLP
jgi:hypothetical protein